MNRITVTGRIVRDIEIKYTQNNTAIIHNSLAVQRDYKNLNGDYEVDYIPFDLWGKRAEGIGKYLSKGDKILLSGMLKTDSYEKEGNKIPTFSIEVDKLEIIATVKKKADNKEETKAETKKLTDEVFEEFGSQIEIDDEDLAF